MELLPLHHSPEHLTTVAQWLYGEWGHLNKGSSVERAMAHLSKKPNRDGLPFSIIAKNNNDVIGIARLVLFDIGIRQNLHPWLSSVYVPPNHRHKGIGRQLCQAIVDVSRELSFQKIYLFTPNKTDFYAHLGWIRLEELEYRNEMVTIMYHENQPPLATDSDQFRAVISAP
ncbi:MULTISPECIES: GNAT family N-acetyltransferase [Thiorhodovibrio]|uniref:GNAT family N-acetyltransferase n=1 Tax=Thiorhodovibrio TaxID=61593 RepID=UPI0019147CEF|nr:MULTISPECIES: GNAT family N-acetyltransferase [Thiorhodovibrio]MBK5968607.1 hypothetical protein [Thiorhodovibrio winogradskyi]